MANEKWKVGVTGHQERDGLDWLWAEEKIASSLKGHKRLEGYSSLASGSDQLFARCVMASGGQNIAVIPIQNYRRLFDKSNVRKYDELLALSKVIQLNGKGSDEEAFLNAGKWIVNHVNFVIAIWDGETAVGKGGTADIVAYSLAIGRLVHHINPIERTVKDLK